MCLGSPYLTQRTISMRIWRPSLEYNWPAVPHDDNAEPIILSDSEAAPRQCHSVLTLGPLGLRDPTPSPCHLIGPLLRVMRTRVFGLSKSPVS